MLLNYKRGITRGETSKTRQFSVTIDPLFLVTVGGLKTCNRQLHAKNLENPREKLVTCNRTIYVTR